MATQTVMISLVEKLRLSDSQGSCKELVELTDIEGYYNYNY